MVQRNENFKKLPGGYLFPEINRRKKEFLAQHPEAKLISLGIGNTTEPLTPHITEALVNGVKALGTVAGYRGYGDEQGDTDLRQKIAQVWYQNKIQPEEVFISDGAKCDIGRLQILFGKNVSFAAQDPSYPVYIDGGVIVGQTGILNNDTRQYDGVNYLPCNVANGFFPEAKDIVGSDIIYICSPNNPTGAVATKARLTELVAQARKQKSIIIFDAAYSLFITDPSLPRSIFEIEGAHECAIEVHSFSKSAGFTGVRLGWAVVPKALKFDDGHAVHADWSRVVTTIFNGASNIAQRGGFAALEEQGLAEMQGLADYYMENAKRIKETLSALKIENYGGDNAPYVWAKFEGTTSWDAFAKVLSEAHIVTTPGSGFGPAGEGFLRFSAFGHKQDVIEACERLKKVSLNNS